ncbi:hypothetical protein [Pseudalkalibacillus salsuginis]|uniref:hypothetical protein n=1 Tax=Pseudalkalibacillus salsuginis TaxID=2910972 RepID=UPI001F239C26|nr:hypothetical protein [Pseudalkalibacillus salsuginis]MCF6409735.1 hypothetical protein [Pseudalkalibacillus salsuginis]
MKRKFIAIGLLFLLILFGCNKEKEYKEILNDERIDTLIHQEKVGEGVVLFYIPNVTSDGELIEARFIEKTLFGWEASSSDRGGGSSLQSIPTIFLPRMSGQSLLFGFNPNKNINKITVEYKYGEDAKEIQAKTIEDNEIHIWFAFVEMPKVKTLYTIKGYSDGKLIETTREESVEPHTK